MKEIIEQIHTLRKENNSIYDELNKIFEVILVKAQEYIYNTLDENIVDLDTDLISVKVDSMISWFLMTSSNLINNKACFSLKSDSVYIS